jgi:hypothetical protein
MKSLNKFTLWNSIIQLLWIKSKGKSGEQPEKNCIAFKGTFIWMKGDFLSEILGA